MSIKSNNAKALYKNIDTQTLGLLHKGIYMILQELHGASSNQLTASLNFETPSVE